MDRSCPLSAGFLYSKTSLRQLLHHPSRQGPREKHGFSGEGLDPFLHFHGIADAVQDDEIGVGGMLRAAAATASMPS